MFGAFARRRRVNRLCTADPRLAVGLRRFLLRSQLCFLPQMPLPPPLQTLARAGGISFGPVGYAAVETDEYKAYKAAQALVETHAEDIEWLLAHATPAGRFYAAALLGKKGAEAHRRALESLVDVRDVVSFGMGGCVMTSAPLGDYARSILTCGDPFRGLPRMTTGPGPGDRPSPRPVGAEPLPARKSAFERVGDVVTAIVDGFDAHRGKIALAFWLVAGVVYLAWLLRK